MLRSTCHGTMLVGSLIQVSDPLGRAVGFGYDGLGDLIVVTDTMGFTTTFACDADHRLLSITDANGHTFVTNVYDGKGRVVSQYDAEGNEVDPDEVLAGLAEGE